MKFNFLLPACLFALCAGRLLADDVVQPPDILLGTSTVLTGPVANAGTLINQGVLAALESANRAGGIHGRHLRLIALDDGYEPARTITNMRQLLQRDKVLAVIGGVGTPTAIAAIPISDQQHTLYFAGIGGAGALRRNPPDHYVFNYRASYTEQVNAMIDALVDGAGLQAEDIAFFTQRDSFGDGGYDAGIAALKRHGLRFVAPCRSGGAGAGGGSHGSLQLGGRPAAFGLSRRKCDCRFGNRDQEAGRQRRPCRQGADCHQIQFRSGAARNGQCLLAAGYTHSR
jgi:hypothetical protein